MANRRAAIRCDRSQGPGSWGYVLDDLSTTIPDSWTVAADVTSRAATASRELHVVISDWDVQWFTDCGTPIGG